MRRKELEIKDIDELESIIKNAEVCHIGLIDGTEPYIVPVFFGYERNTIYFHSALEGRKVALIKKNKRVCFEIENGVEIINSDKLCDFSAKYQSIIGVGNAYLLKTIEEKVHGLKLLMKKYGYTKPDLRFQKLDSTLVVKIVIEQMTGKKKGY
jgi:nitroimidazol reductase NimA-like FMN-containing flavoprotein (pyridoxamine 5'-phosphate oxidase superfamily)